MKDSVVPAYYRVEMDILEKIKQDIYKVGELLSEELFQTWRMKVISSGCKAKGHTSSLKRLNKICQSSIVLQMRR